MKDYNNLSHRLKKCLDTIKPNLDDESFNHALHYVDHGELEMAYESFILSCIEEKITIDSAIAEELQSIGRALNMEMESVFTPDFWQQAQKLFSQMNTHQP